MPEYNIKFLGDYIVRRDKVGMDGDETLYEYSRLDRTDYKLLRGMPTEETEIQLKLLHVYSAGKGMLYLLKSSDFDWVEVKLGSWKFWFQGDPDEPSLEVISHLNSNGDVDAEYVFMSPGEYETAFRA